MYSAGARVKLVKVESAPSFSIAPSVLQIQWLQSEIEQMQQRESRYAQTWTPLWVKVVRVRFVLR